MLFNILTLISFFIILLTLNTLTGVFPSLIACLIRWKESVNLDASVQLSRARDLMAATLIIPFCLVAYKYHLYTPSWIEGMNVNAGLAATIGIFVAFILLRTVLEYWMRPTKMNPKTFRTACKASYTFFSILTLISLSVGSIMTFADANPEVIKNAILCISATIYALHLVRKFQIFISSCSFFTAFLYLCALEIFPTGLLVFSASVF